MGAISRDFKYVIVKSERVILLAPTLNHSDVVGENLVAESAGSCRIFEDNGKFTVSCCGESTTLQLRSRKKEDAAIIENYLNDPNS